MVTFTKTRKGHDSGKDSYLCYIEIGYQGNRSCLRSVHGTVSTGEQTLEIEALFTPWKKVRLISLKIDTEGFN